MLQETLGNKFEIGTVDKFQGREAPIVIISMAASDIESAPRGAEFLLERNRLYCLFTHYSRGTILKFLPSLIVVDIAVSFFYLKNGLFFEKIKASFNILKNFSIIQSKYNEIQRNRTINDKEIVSSFKDEVILPKGTSIKNKLPFNSLLRTLSGLCRKVI